MTGLSTPYSQSDRPVSRTVVQPLQRFLSTEAASGLVLLAAAATALVWANLAPEGYEGLWTTEVALTVGGFTVAEPLRLWVNDLGMALFFFVVGLEVKRELTLGRLADPGAAVLPIACALGGMVVPALLYLAFNAGGPGAGGWGMPMATDIAFALGVLVLLGRRAPLGLRVFLLTLAVADDLGAIAVIAVFYSSDIAALWLAVALGTVATVVALERLHVRALAPYVIAAGVLWFAVFESGVHATLAGVVLGFLTPHRPFHPPEAVVDEAVAHLERLREDPPTASPTRGSRTPCCSSARSPPRRCHPWPAWRTRCTRGRPTWCCRCSRWPTRGSRSVARRRRRWSAIR